VAVSALTRRVPQNGLPQNERLRWVKGDLSNATVSTDWLAPGGILIHLAYASDWTTQAHLESVLRLARAVSDSGVRRVVHCSTAVVAGRTAELRVSETTPPFPLTDYERTKLAIESAWRDCSAGQFDLAIARPGAVFGPGGKNLVKLADALTAGGRIANYLRSSLFGGRNMNLVCVDNVIAALVFLADRSQPSGGEAFIVSEDDDSLNNFRDVEHILMREFGMKDYALPPLPVPPPVLGALLRLTRRSSADPRCVYDGARLRDAGWRKACSLEQGLREFAAWYVSRRRLSA
jgi:nucleoside-diphosphate-sugar epimerase